MNQVAVVEGLNEVIRMQSDIIDDLFSLLMQHISAADAEKITTKIRSASEKAERLGVEK
jgi:hypothetical protein